MNKKDRLFCVRTRPIMQKRVPKVVRENDFTVSHQDNDVKTFFFHGHCRQPHCTKVLLHPEHNC